MAKELTRAGATAVANILSGKNSPFLKAARMAGGDRPSGMRYLRFSGNTGLYTLKDEIVPDGTLFAFDVENVELQWLGWSNGRPKERVKIHLLNDGVEKLPTIAELPSIQKVKQMDGWKLTAVFRIRDMDGEYGELELTLPAENDRQWPRPSWVLINDCGQAWADGKVDKDGHGLVPIVELGAEAFDSQGGTKYSTVLKIVDWMSREDLAKAAELHDAHDGEEIHTLEDSYDDDDEDEVPARAAGRGARA